MGLDQGATIMMRRLCGKPLRLSIRGFASKPVAVPMKNLSESWATPTSSNYLEAMYRRWQKDPASVHASWQSYFQNLDAAPGNKQQTEKKEKKKKFTVLVWSLLCGLLGSSQHVPM